jgi:TRAP-type C4-dicarboxylate transport system permease small subunit
VSEAPPRDLSGRAVSFLDSVAHVGVWIGGGLLLATAALISFDIVARKLFGWSSVGSDEIAGYALAIASAWAFAFTLLRRGHIRIDLIYNLCPRGLRAVLDIVALAALIGFAGLLAWRGYGVLSTSISLEATANTPLATPLWLPQGPWFAGLVFLVLVAVTLLLAALSALLRGDAKRVETLIGIPSLDEEVAVEMREAEKQASRAGAGGV